MKTLRARLLQYIIAVRMKEKYGEQWWATELLPHMRDSAMHRPDRAGEKYAIALKTYGREIRFEDLDTTACCAIILFDSKYQYGKTALKFTNYETGITRQLHALRNKISHEESEQTNASAYEERTVRVLYDAMKTLRLIENDPNLARDILKEYVRAFGNDSGNLEEKLFLEWTEKFEEAEKLSQWDMDRALPVYANMAQEGFVPAQKKLLWIYTHTVQYYDLRKACEITNKYSGIYTEEQTKKLKLLLSLQPHALWGTPEVSRFYLNELKDGAVIQNAEIEVYIRWINTTFSRGLLSLLSEKNSFAVEASKKCPDIKRLRALSVNAGWNIESDYESFLVELAERGKFDTAGVIASMTELAKNGHHGLLAAIAQSGVAFGELSIAEWKAVAEKYGIIHKQEPDCLHEGEVVQHVEANDEEIASLHNTNEEFKRHIEEMESLVERYKTIVLLEGAAIVALITLVTTLLLR